MSIYFYTIFFDGQSKEVRKTQPLNFAFTIANMQKKGYKDVHIVFNGKEFYPTF